MSKYYPAIVVNLFLATLVYWLWYIGEVDKAIENNVLYIMQGIILVWVVSLVRVERAYSCIGVMIAMGFLGSLYGMADSMYLIGQADLSDSSAASTTVQSALKGVGAAIWTTIVAVFFSTWTRVNVMTRFTDDE